MNKLKFFLTIVIAFSFFQSCYSKDITDKYKIGDKVSDFSITNYDGATYSLNTAGSKVTVLMFWSTECPFVQPYTERIINLVNEFGSKGVVFWGINSNKTEPTEEVMSHTKDKNYNFPMLKDVNSVVADQFSAERTPEVFVIDDNMTLIYHGRIDNNRESDKVTSNDLQKALNEFLSGQEISNKETKSFGCTIKR